MSMWGGRFSTGPAASVAKMGESVSYDRRLYRHDIQGSITHARMLGRQNIIPKSDADKLVEGLRSILEEVDGGRFEWKESLEDVHMNIESRLTEIAGDVGGRLHAARSRNDQVATTTRLYLREEVDGIMQSTKRVQRVLVMLAEKHVEVVLPGFTHLQHAQPVVLGHYFMAYCEMLQRDVGRLKDWRRRMNKLPLGAGALAGTTLPIDREWVAAELGFDGLCPNSMDAVSDRDFGIELLSCLSILMMHMSRISEDIIFWMSQEAGWVELGDEFCTGSSIMPQKKNPDMCELARGKTGRVYGDLMTLLSVMKGLPLCYNRDMQEDKEPIFDAIDTVKLVLLVYAPMLESMKVNADRMYAAASDPALMATDLAEWLVRQGMPFRQAHHRVGHLVGYCNKNKIALTELTLSQLQETVPEAKEECLNLWKPDSSVRLRDIVGGTSPKQVSSQIRRWRDELAKDAPEK